MNTKYISTRQAALLKGMQYETFRWWVNRGRGPKRYVILGRIGFIKEEVLAWNPVYSGNWGGNRYGDKK